MADKAGPITFDLSKEQQAAMKTIAGNLPVRVSGRLVGGRVRVDFIACNSPFTACNAAFTACNAAFTACNAAFAKDKK